MPFSSHKTSAARGLTKYRLLSLGLLLTGLGLNQAVTAREPLATGAAMQEVQAAVAADQRLTRDKERDAERHPLEILEFFGVAPGQTVLDLFSGGGYYSELLARIVGDKGKVIAHNNQAYLPYAKEDLAERDYAKRLPQVEQLIAEANELTLAPESLDGVFFVLGFHDMFYQTKHWPQIDAPKLLTKLHASLKPGGYMAVIDHDAAPDSGTDMAQKYHRLARKHVLALMADAGFEFAGSTHVLENEEDRLDTSVFEPGIRGKTSRYVLKFIRR